MFCMNCGNQVSNDSMFCPICGQPTKPQNVAASAPAAQPAPAQMPPTNAYGYTNQQVPPAQVYVQRKSVTQTVGDAVGGMADKLYEATGGSGHAELRFKDFFSEVFKGHEKGASEELFICGTKTTTPDIKNVSAEWPKPWVWSRVLFVLLATLVLLYSLLYVHYNQLAIPGIMFVGALAVPFATLIFFFETNAPRNISLVKTITIFFVGGAASLIALYLLPADLLKASGTIEFGPSMLTGLLEEIAKLAIIVVTLSLMKQSNSGKPTRIYILNGLLVGAAVGAGFAVFETAGYIFANTMKNGYISEGIFYFNLAAMNNTLVMRSLLAVGGHVAWAAAIGAALVLGDQDNEVSAAQVSNPFAFSVVLMTKPAFLIIFALCVGFHGVWDAAIPVLDEGILLSMRAKYILLIIAIWIVVAVMLKRGLDQVNQLANKAENSAPVYSATASAAASTPATMPTADSFAQQPVEQPAVGGDNSQ